MKKVLLSIAIVLIATVVNAADFKRALTLEDCYDAACRVSVTGARGSACHVFYKNGKSYFITNYHVVGKESTAVLEFEKTGSFKSLRGNVIWRAYDQSAPYDFALIEVSSEELKNKIDPPYIPLAGAEFHINNGGYIISSGAPKGHYVSCWKGKAIGYENGEILNFKPAPYPGQSGSSIVSFVGGKPYVTAILTWLIGNEGQDSSKGGAISIGNFYAALEKIPLTPVSTGPNGKAPSLIPEGAVECASNYVVLYFTQANCPACNMSKAGVDQLINDGYTVNEVDIKGELGAKLREAYSVYLTPTFVVIDENQNEIGRYAGYSQVADRIKIIIQEDELKKADNNKPTEQVCDGDVCEIQPANNDGFISDESLTEEEEPVENETQEESVEEETVEEEQQEEVEPEEPKKGTKEEMDKRPTVYVELSGNQRVVFEGLGEAWKKERGSQKKEDAPPSNSIIPNEGNSKTGLFSGTIESIKNDIQESIQEQIDLVKKDILKVKIKLGLYLLVIVVFGVWIADGSKKGIVILCNKSLNCCKGSIQKLAQKITEGNNERKQD